MLRPRFIGLGDVARALLADAEGVPDARPQDRRGALDRDLQLGRIGHWNLGGGRLGLGGSACVSALEEHCLDRWTSTLGLGSGSRRLNRDGKPPYGIPRCHPPPSFGWPS